MNTLNVTYAGAYQTGGNLFRIIVSEHDTAGALIREYEVWPTLAKVKNELHLNAYPTNVDLTIFGLRYYKNRLTQTNFNPKETGAFVSDSAEFFGDAKTFPGAIPNLESMIQTNISLPTILHNWVKEESFKTKRSLSEVIRSSLDEYRFKALVRSKYAALFDVNKELDNLIGKILDMDLKVSNRRQHVAAFCLGKAYKTHKAITVLCEQGFGQDAAILLRSLFDLTLSLLYITQKDEDYYAERYFDYLLIKQEKMLDYMNSIPELKTNFNNEAKKRGSSFSEKELRKQAKEAREKYHYIDSFDWSDKSMQDMAKEVGRGNMQKSIYRLLADISHSSANSISEYMDSSQKNIVIDVSQGTKFVNEALVGAFDCVYNVLTVMNKLFDLKMEKDIEDIASRYITLLELEKE